MFQPIVKFMNQFLSQFFTDYIIYPVYPVYPVYPC
jgi:hypothetical protein